MTNETKSPYELLQSLFSKTLSALLARIEDGTYTAKDLEVARQFLKDSNIQALPEADRNLTALRDSLPFTRPAEEAA